MPSLPEKAERDDAQDAAIRSKLLSVRSVVLRESIEKRFCSLEISRVEPLGEPVVDRLENRYGVSGTALIAQQPSQARGRRAVPRTARLAGAPGQALAGSNPPRTARLLWAPCHRRGQLAPDAQQLGQLTSVRRCARSASIASSISARPSAICPATAQGFRHMERANRMSRRRQNLASPSSS